MSYIKQSLGLLFVAGAFATTSMAQERAAAWQTQADRAYASLRYHDALQSLLQGYTRLTASGTQGEKAASVSARIADCYWLMRNYDSAYRWYAALPPSALAADAKAKVRMADLLAIRGQYARAAQMLDGVPGYEKKGAGFRGVSGLKADSADWTVQYLESLNTPFFREFSPTLVDGGLVWSTNIPAKGGPKGVMGWDNNGYTRLMTVGSQEGLSYGPTPGRAGVASSTDASPTRLAGVYDLSDFEKPYRVTVPAASKEKVAAILALAKPLDISGGLSYNQAHSTYDAKSGQFFFSANRQEKLKGQMRTVGLVSGTLRSGAVADAKFVLPDGKDHSMMHPAIHPDGQQLVFASDRPGGRGGYDLYVVSRSGSGDWSEPRALAGANTAGNEMFPSFGPDGRLYFSSDGHAGLGCLDMYSATFQNGDVKDLRHLPYPVNSAYDDFGMAVAADGKTGFFSSDRAGSDDLYRYVFEKKSVRIDGAVKSETTGTGKPGVTVVLERRTDARQYEQEATTRTDDKGGYTFTATPGRPYRIQYIDGDRRLSQEVTAPGAGRNMKAADIVMQDKVKPVEKAPEPVVETEKEKTTAGNTGSTGAVVKNEKEYKVFFDYNSHRVRAEDMTILQEVTAALKAGDAKICILSGHTDADGDDEGNMELSMRRASAVKQKLTRMGIAASRIRIEYYGKSRLVSETSDRAEALVNRRVEIILKAD
jgi:outer membrane protein OmpA-like peptidoglycan-associated protein